MLHQYEHDPCCSSYGEEAANLLNVNSDVVFKTLVVDVDASYFAVAILPVSKQLSLKKLAKALTAKKIKMADSSKVQSSTGYVLGGVSPLGQKKKLKTIIDSQANLHSTMFISGGKRGLEIELPPSSLIDLLNAELEDITIKKETK